MDRASVSFPEATLPPPSLCTTPLLTLLPRERVHLAGNGVHVHVMMAWVLYNMAHLVRRETIASLNFVREHRLGALFFETFANDVDTHEVEAARRDDLASEGLASDDLGSVGSAATACAEPDGQRGALGRPWNAAELC